ncbi:hypothetical protein L0F63_004523 [Massospora cicadina]|nr:hypothetical protein L0F63_004523 [Massospora cicadina]
MGEFKLHAKVSVSMFNLRPLVRTLPHKSVSTLANGQTSSRPKFTQSGITQQSAVASILNSFSLRSYAAVSDPICSTTPPSPFPRSEEPKSPLELLSERQFQQLKEDLYKQALLPINHCDASLSVPFENTSRGRACLDALVSGLHANRRLEESESVVRLAMRVFGVEPSAGTLWLLLSMQVEQGDWAGFVIWFDIAAKCQALSPQHAWESLVQASFDADVPPYERSLYIFQTLTGFQVPMSSEVLRLVVNELHFHPELIDVLFQALALVKDPTSDVVRCLLQVVLKERGWVGVVKALKENSRQLSKKVDMLYWAGTLASDFPSFMMLVRFLQNCEVGEAFQSRFVDLWLERHRAARCDLKGYSLDVAYFHLLLKKLVRQKASPDCAIEVLADMKRLGIRGHEEIRTVVDILLLNLGLSRSTPSDRKAELKARIDELLPHVTLGAAGESMRSNLEAQDANHRILQSQDPWQCAAELRLMLDNRLRPSSVAITHTLARFLHSKHYSEGLNVFRQMLPSLQEIAKETGWMSACGPVYNFAIRLCCRRVLTKEAHNLVRELESNHGFLDAFASAEIVILAQKTSGYAEAIRVGTERLDALRQRRLKVPPYFFNVLLNTMAEGGHLNAMWQLMDELSVTHFVPTAVTYGTLVKAALKGRDYPRARLLCSQAIQAKVYSEGPAMPIFSQILEYNLEHRRIYQEVADLLAQVKSLSLPTNPRFDLLKLRALTEIEPSQPKLVLSTLQEMESTYRVPAGHYQLAINNLLRISAHNEVLEVMTKMRTCGITPDLGAYTTLLNSLNRAGGPSTREMDRALAMYRRDYPHAKDLPLRSP